MCLELYSDLIDAQMVANNRLRASEQEIWTMSMQVVGDLEGELAKACGACFSQIAHADSRITLSQLRGSERIAGTDLI